MFALHETTRRRLTQTGFVVGCLLPTLAIVVCSWRLSRSEYRDAVATALGDRLGLAASIGRVRHPKPDVTLLDEVALADPETGARVARARLIEIESGVDVTTIRLSQLELAASDWSDWWELAQRELRHARRTSGKLRVSAGEITLRLASGDQTLTDVRCQSESSEAGSQLGVSFRVAGREMPEPATLSVFRSRQTSPATAGFELHTGETFLHGGLLIAAWPPAGHLGRHARFRGSLRAVNAATGWEGEIAGQLDDIDLEELVSAQFLHKLSGRGRLDLEHLRFRANRIEQASGALAAGPGRAGRGLLKAAADALGFEPVGEIKTIGQSIPYERLAVAFDIDPHGLSLRGQCPVAPGVALQGHELALMAEPKRASQPVVNLVRWLAPQSEVQAPATRESSALAAILPVPELVPPPSSDDANSAPATARRIRLLPPGTIGPK